ncbi:carboxypeptidase-like regulatory domain-containing protein [Hymenobacter edaphi]|uniref:Carboxypeptidase-like regulatory domain-containing protein n=1 Tax=Hymenobacter edaphi TaxID=2211146 RepID=A0A328B8E2_9BACT|nr:carboxypeptidase-like regulatory domain-containing protein [Hymenobacter edaphi]RAK62681.1 hypothetical protein DLM85_22700 [Hymenobacter edaphi]
MRRAFLLLLPVVGLVAGRAVAQAPAPRPVLGGVVLSGARQPLAGVSVLVRGTTLVTSTNAEGRFLLPELPRGPLTLRFELSGFVVTDVAVADTARAPLQVRLLSTRPPVRTRRN